MRRLVILSIALTSACVPPPPEVDAGTNSGADAGTDAACPLSQDAKVLLQQTVADYVRDVGVVGSHMRDEASARESAYAISLIGNPSKGRAGFAFLVQSCTERMAFDPYCEPADFEDESHGELCLRLRCDAADILVSESWYAEEGHSAPDDRHVFTTTTEQPVGEVAYDPNPFIIWRADVSNDADVTVTADLDVGAVVTPDEGAAIDVSHQGSVSARRVVVGEDEEVSVEVDVRFGAIAADGAVTAAVFVAADGALTGGIDLGDEHIADLPASYDVETGLHLTWKGSCAH